MSRVSVIVPVHNTETFLEKCLDSIRCQTLQDIEIILVENGSTDNSLSLCHALAAQDSRIRVLHLAEGDLSTARNAGVEASVSPYVGFVDSDDTILPTMFEEMYRVAVDNNLDLVSCNFVCKFDDRPDIYLFPQDGKVSILSPKEMTSLNFEEKIPRTVWSMLYKRELCLKYKFPEKILYEDRASTFLLMAHCRMGAVINKAYYCYYQRMGSICHNKTFLNYRDYVLSDYKRLEFLNKSEMFTSSEKARLGHKTASVLPRHLRKLFHLAKTREQKDEFLSLANRLSLIPKGSRLAPNGFFSLIYVWFIKEIEQCKRFCLR